MIKLGVNIDHVATLRQARREGIPDIVEAARAAVRGGADGITVHLRQDRRHIQDEDVVRLKKELPDVPLNLEMAAVDEIIDIARNLKPECVCIVPEKREELTTEGGLDVVQNFSGIERAVDILKSAGIEVSLFIDPLPAQIDASKSSGADAVELHTGGYANKTGSGRQDELEKLKAGVLRGLKAGLKVNAGHGLDYENVQAVKEIDGLSDLNIGYSIVCRAVFVGLESAVREMKELLK